MSGQTRTGQVRLALVAFLMVMAAVAVTVPAAAKDQDQSESVTIKLNEYKGSGVSGTATLTAKGDEVIVASQITGKPVKGDHPTHIHAGTCDNFDPNPTFPLNTVVLDPTDNTGVSKTTVDAISLDELLRGDWVILVHKSAEELTTYFVCGEIKAEDNASGGQAGTGAMSTVASTGVGTAADDRGNTTLLLTTLCALAVGTAAAALVIHRRQTRA